MILITGTVVVAPDNRAAFLKAAEHQVTHSRQEEGCQGYTCNEDVMAPNTFVFVERWRDQAAVQIHFAKDYSRLLVSEMQRLAINAPVVEIHEIANTRELKPGR
jgi:quinol monooxygenase YgiN